MGDFDQRNAAGEYDPTEAHFTDDEIRDALAIRQRCLPTRARDDNCPHCVPCDSVANCVELIAWYRRHCHEIERRIAAGGELARGYILPADEVV